MKAKIRDIVASVLPEGAVFDVVPPEHPEHGHFSTNAAMRLAKEEKKPPLEVAKELAKKIEAVASRGMFSKIEAAPPGFVNFWLSDETVKKEFARLVSEGIVFPNAAEHEGRTVIVEYASLNIAKPFHVGYLRNIAIGDALAKLYAALGYHVIRWNYLGDWGTQFGKLIAAYKMWGKKEEVEKAPIQAMLDLYVRFHHEIIDKPEWEEMGRAEFKKLEDGDKENRALWQWFKEESLKEFAQTLEKLNVEFDVDIGESFYEGKLADVVKRLIDKGIARPSEGAIIVPLDEFKLPPALIQKSDGGSLYHTRDIANIEYRLEQYHPVKILYVVGNEQSLHFEQLFKIAALAGLGTGVEFMHVKFGLVFAERGQKFSTRSGNIIRLEEVLAKAQELARTVVEKKNPDLTESEKTAIAEAVALGALKYTNLCENRNSDVVFDWDKMLDFSGDSGPYLQYTYARLMSILRKAGEAPTGDPNRLESETEFALVRKMAGFPDAVRVAAESYAVNHFTNYLYELAVAANKLYETTPILADENADRRNARLLLVATVAKVLEKGLGMLGIKALEKI